MEYFKKDTGIVQALRYLQLIFIILLILYFGKTLFVPMFYGLLIAIVLYPFCSRLEAKRLGKTLSITVSLLVVIILFTALVCLLAWQLAVFRRDVPELLHKLKPFIEQIRYWVAVEFSISLPPQDQWLANIAQNISGNTRWFITFLNTTTGILFSLFITPIYSALFLYHRSTFITFLYCIFGNRYKRTIYSIATETVYTYYNYIKGMILVYIIVGILNSVGLIALGVKHAILFGMLTAIMTIIPYVGIIVSALLPISVAFITTNSIWYPLGVILVFSIVQYLEANVIFPKVVGSQLNVSTWAMLIAIIVGGIIWGVSGMILFIPFVAILKIIADHVDALHAIRVILSRTYVSS